MGGHVPYYLRAANKLGLQVSTGLNSLQNSVAVSHSLASFPSLCFPTSESWDHLPHKPHALSQGLLLNPGPLCHLCPLHLLFSSPGTLCPLCYGPICFIPSAKSSAKLPGGSYCFCSQALNKRLLSDCFLAELGPSLHQTPAQMHHDDLSECLSLHQTAGTPCLVPAASLSSASMHLGFPAASPSLDARLPELAQSPQQAPMCKSL